MKDWTATYAAWTYGATRPMVKDPSMVGLSRRFAREELALELAAVLAREDAEAIEEPTVSLVSAPPGLRDAFGWYPVDELFVAEVRALKLGTPNPFPSIVAVDWRAAWRRWEELWHGLIVPIVGLLGLGTFLYCLARTLG